MGGQMINVGGHFLSKEAGQLNFVGIHPGGGAPVPPPKPGSKGTGAAGGAGDAGGLGGSDHGKAGKGEGASVWSPLKGWYPFWAFLGYICFIVQCLLMHKLFKYILTKYLTRFV